MNDRDIQLIEHMIRYCKEITGTVSFFGNDKAAFLENYIYFNSCSTPILQIGELAKRVSDDLIKTSRPLLRRKPAGRHEHRQC